VFIFDPRDIACAWIRRYVCTKKENNVSIAR
jgi:hypothetical protein